jgi:hypothetical protein
VENKPAENPAAEVKPNDNLAAGGKEDSYDSTQRPLSDWSGGLGGGAMTKALKVGGRAAIPVGVVVSGVEIAKSPHPVYEVGRQASGWAGAAAGGWVGAKGGAAVGASIGAFFGGVGAAPGAVVGGFVGGLVGGVAGWFGGTKTYEAAVPTPSKPND